MLKEGLARAGFSIWMDIEQMGNIKYSPDGRNIMRERTLTMFK